MVFDRQRVDCVAECAVERTHDVELAALAVELEQTDPAELQSTDGDGPHLDGIGNGEEAASSESIVDGAKPAAEIWRPPEVGPTAPVRDGARKAADPVLQVVRRDVFDQQLVVGGVRFESDHPSAPLREVAGSEAMVRPHVDDCVARANRDGGYVIDAGMKDLAEHSVRGAPALETEARRPVADGDDLAAENPLRNPKPASMFAFSRPSCKTDARC